MIKSPKIKKTQAKTSPTLGHFREKIDSIDTKILTLLGQRGQAVEKIGRLKAKAGQAFHVPEREASMLRKLLAQNPGPYKPQAVEAIFREIISASLALEAPLRIAYLGPQASFSHLAARRHFGVSANCLPLATLKSIFIEVVNQRADYGVVPVENSTEGVVSQTLDLFVDFDVKICGELKLKIRHQLLSTAKELSQIKKVYSHTQALAQCRAWLEQHLPHATLVPVDSTAKAAQLAAQQAKSAAIASEYAAECYSIKILCSNIQDFANNHTRFLIIGRQETKASGDDKTSVVFGAKDGPGVLYEILKPLADHKINLSNIQSRPLRGRNWEYLFFIDLDGHQQDKYIAEAIQSLMQHSTYFHNLGSYPKGKEY